MSSQAVPPRHPAIVGRSLVISNDSSSVLEITAMLQQFAISVDVCAQPTVAVRLINTRKFEAILVDLALRDEVVPIFERVRLSPSNENSVIFALASVDEELRFEIRPNFIVRKPLVDCELQTTLRAALGLVIRDYRRYFRCPVTAPVLIRIGEQAEVLSEMMNISEGGLAVATPVVFTPGTVVSVEFALPGEGAKFEIESEVCWCDQKGHAGLHFRSMSESQSFLLQSWLSRKIEDGIPEPMARLFQKHNGNSAQTPR